MVLVLEELIKNIGVERRLMTAGKNKGMLDPFLPIVPEQEEFVQNLLNEIHDQFIAVVKKGRGDRLSTDRIDIFRFILGWKFGN